MRDAAYTAMTAAFPAMPSHSHSRDGPPEQDRGPLLTWAHEITRKKTPYSTYSEEVLEYNSKMDGRGADRQGRQAAEKIRPDSGRAGADIAARQDRSAHTRIVGSRLFSGRASVNELKPRRYIARRTPDGEDCPVLFNPVRGQRTDLH